MELIKDVSSSRMTSLLPGGHGRREWLNIRRLGLFSDRMPKSHAFINTVTKAGRKKQPKG